MSATCQCQQAPVHAVLAGVPLCEACAAGAISSFATRGWALTTRERQEDTILGTVPVVEVTVDTGGTHELRARFVPVRRRSRALTWFADEHRTGLPEFDEHIATSSDTPEAITAFLDRPEVREALLSVLQGKRELALDGGWLALRAESESDVAHIRALALALGTLL